MKKLLFTSALLLTFTFAINSFAQTTPAPANVDEKASVLTRDMSQQLGLNELEYIKLKALNRERLTKSKQIKTMYSNDIAMRDRKMGELERNYEAELKSFLNAKQEEAYVVYKTNPTNYTALSSEE